MDELKNMVIQTLETNGILGQLRAQLRSCVFKVIDNQEQIEKGQSGFHWENPNARKVMQTASGVICAELVKEFLEFYKLDYTLAIFMPEVNLNSQKALSKEELSKKIGLSQVNGQQPLMAQLIESFLSDDKPQSTSFIGGAQKKEEDKIEPLISQQQKKAQEQQQNQSQSDISKTSNKSNTYQQQPQQQQQQQQPKKDDHEKHLEKASKMLEEQKREEKSGYNIGAGEKKNPYQQQKSNKEDDNIIDTYGDDFEDEIEEDLPDVNNLLESNENVNAHQGITQSIGGMTVSQSLGVDPSVDSLALEDYDHIEPVERIS